MILEMTSNIHYAFAREDETSDEPPFRDLFGNVFDDLKCPSGTEKFEELSLEQLRRRYLGFQSFDDVMGLNRTSPRDPLLKKDPWVDEEFFADEHASHLQPFRLDAIQWHAIAALTSNAFDGLPTAITDEVGAGKTLSTLGFFNQIIRFRDYHVTNKLFPATEFGRCHVAICSQSPC
jgi:SNF2 family DNA or RNA helicase